MEDATYVLEFEKPLRELEKQLVTLQAVSKESKVDVKSEFEAIELKIERTKADIYSNLTAWQRVQLSRHPKRPYSLDYIGAFSATLMSYTATAAFARMRPSSAARLSLTAPRSWSSVSRRVGARRTI